MSGLEYWKVTSADELEKVVSKFFQPSEHPILLEAITDADTDGRELRSMLARNRKKVTLSMRVKNKLARMIKK